MRWSSCLACLAALAAGVSACAEGDSGILTDVRRGDATGDRVSGDAPTDAPAGDAPDAPVGRACMRNDDCTAPDLCMNAQRCQGGHCVVIGGADSCEDPYACTDDRCDSTRGACTHVPNDDRCPSGQFCDPMNGCVRALPCEVGDATCNRLNMDPCMGTWSCDAARLVCVRSLAPDCNDMDPCTTDTCTTMGTTYMCGHSNMFDYATNPMHCGGCMRACPTRANATATCAMSNCSWACNPMAVDRNGDVNAARDATSDGCECLITDANDTPDPMFQDTNCDGIDGTIGRAIFVSTVRGSDSNPGTMEMPMATIIAALTRATASTPPKDIYVAFGTYTGSFALASGVSIYGGYDDSHIPWGRAATPASVIQGNTATAVSGFNIDQPIEVQLLTIRAPSATMPGESSYGVRIANSPARVTVRNCNVFAGNGAPGGAGANGANGANGGNGGFGGNTSGVGGAAGGSACGAAGGAGGPAVSGPTAGRAGADGASVFGGGRNGSGGLGGSAGNSCCLPGDGGPAPDTASPGDRGSNGVNGTAVAALGMLAMDGLYVTPVSGSGTNGTPGGGGGGGGSGGAAASGCPFSCTDRTSGGGGGGGAGGCGGVAGRGGSGGGGSFAILSASSSLRIDACQLTAGRGGDGGTGGNGGNAGAPGSGGGGGPAGSNSGTGAPGKSGGQGGAGGSGAGGAGGPSFCIYYTGTAPSLGTNPCTRGGGGAGGSGGSNAAVGTAASGAAGASDDVRAGM